MFEIYNLLKINSMKKFDFHLKSQEDNRKFSFMQQLKLTVVACWMQCQRNLLMLAGRTARKKILKHPVISLVNIGLIKEASKRIFFLALLMFTITLSKAQVSDGYLWVAVADSSALPISPTETANPALNAIFETFKVTNYFYRFDYHCLVDVDSGVKIFTVYEIQYDSIDDNNRQNIYSESNFYSNLENSGLFYHVFNFSINSDRRIEAVYLDSSARSVSDTSSANEDVNAILREFNVIEYVYPSYPPPPFNYPLNHIFITCNNCDIIDLQIRLSELDSVFLGFFIFAEAYPDTDMTIDEITKEQFKIYPNPFSDYITIDNDKLKSVAVYTISGQQICSQDEGSFQNIDLSFLSDGVYILKMETTDNKFAYHKIMKGGKL
jgi:hypothetical protein